MRRKKIIIVFIIMATLSFLVINALQPKEKIITGTKDNLVKVRIVFSPTENPKEIVFDDKASIDKLYDIIQETNKIKINRYPNHSDSIQSDSKFSLELFYRDGQVDLLNTPEAQNRIYRILDTKGSSGDPGYVSGYNKNLWVYLNKLEAKD